jgi:hypothetical protein
VVRSWVRILAAILVLAAAPGCGGPVRCTNPACPVCGGKGQYTCARCEGKGTIPCPTCNGRNPEKCPTCGGTGRVRCSLCGGSGIKVHLIPRR